MEKLFPDRRFRFHGPDRSFPVIGSEEFNLEYRAAARTGRVGFGSERLFYRDLGKKYYCPYDYIERSFVRISECQPDDSPAYYYYRVILIHGEKEFANLIFNEEKDADYVVAHLKEISPGMETGYVPPADGKYRARFK